MLIESHSDDLPFPSSEHSAHTFHVVAEQAHLFPLALSSVIGNPPGSVTAFRLGSVLPFAVPLSRYADSDTHFTLRSLRSPPSGRWLGQSRQDLAVRHGTRIV